MSKYILIPDSFKGTMSSSTVCRVMAEQIRKHEPAAEIAQIPVADGGEGSVDCFLEAVGGVRETAKVTGVFAGDVIDSFYGRLNDGRTAVVEMAACAGLPLAEGRLDPMRATTYGVGELILSAARSGAKRIVMGLGGSATNDGGCGAAAACGVRFLDRDGSAFVPTGGTLKDIQSIDMRGFAPELGAVEFTAMCDIDNPMAGKRGAAYVFGPQKGADEHLVELLDEGLKHLAGVIRRDIGKDVAALPGAGAAGAMGAGMVAFFGAKLEMGIETVLDVVNFDQVLRGADCVLTGEGRIDSQSLGGKVPIGVARRAKKQNVPVIAIVGAIADDIEKVYDEGITAVMSINRAAIDFSVARNYAQSNLAYTVDTLMRLRRIRFA